MGAGRLFLGGLGAGMLGAVVGVTTGAVMASQWPAWLWAMAGSTAVSALAWIFVARRHD